MQSLVDSISRTIDWLYRWEIVPPIDTVVASVELAIKDFHYYKTAEQFESRLTNLVKALYNDTIKAPEFVDALGALIARQITLAYREAWNDEGGGQFPDYLTAASEAAILAQFDFVDQFARDIVDARIDKTPIDGLLARVPLWANRYNEAYNDAVMLITKEAGGNLEWVLGETEQHCSTCANLNGIVARASEWEALNVKPQNSPNDKIECGGWRCDCTLTPTDKRRTPGAYGRIEEAIL